MILFEPWVWCIPELGAEDKKVPFYRIFLFLSAVLKGFESNQKSAPHPGTHQVQLKRFANILATHLAQRLQGRASEISLEGLQGFRLPLNLPARTGSQSERKLLERRSGRDCQCYCQSSQVGQCKMPLRPQVAKQDVSNRRASWFGLGRPNLSVFCPFFVLFLSFFCPFLSFLSFLRGFSDLSFCSFLAY